MTTKINLPTRSKIKEDRQKLHSKLLKIGIPENLLAEYHLYPQWELKEESIGIAIYSKSKPGTMESFEGILKKYLDETGIQYECLNHLCVIIFKNDYEDYF